MDKAIIVIGCFYLAIVFLNLVRQAYSESQDIYFLTLENINEEDLVHFRSENVVG